MGRSLRSSRFLILLIIMLLNITFRPSVVSAQGSISVSITSPQNNANLSGMQTVTVMASSSGGVIASVSAFYVQGTIPNVIPGATWTICPCTTNWDTSKVDNGTYQLYAQAFDSQGSSQNSTAITVHIQNGAVAGAPVLTPGSGALLVVILALAAVGVMILYRSRSRKGLKLPNASTR